MLLLLLLRLLLVLLVLLVLLLLLRGIVLEIKPYVVAHAIDPHI